MKKLSFLFLFLFLLSISTLISAQETSSTNEPNNLSFSGFLDSYLAHDFNDPFTDTRPYTTQAVYEDQARVNLATATTQLNSENLRGKLTLQTGDSVKANYAAEEDLFWRYIQEANTGFKISKNLWFDGGIYLSHIGLESFNSRDNWNYSRSMVAEYSPYYETGGKLTYQVSDDFSAQFHILHGWQNISSSSEPGYGIQLAYNLNPATQLTYANYLGEQDGGFRNFHDFIVKREINNKWSIATQIDFGHQERQNQDSATWYGWTVVTKYELTPKFAIGGRVEHYDDPDQVLLTTLNQKRYNATGLSVNFDYEILQNLSWRNEYRIFFAQDPVFPEDSSGQFSNNEHFIVTSLAYFFES